MNEKEPNILNTKEIEVTLEQITDWKKGNVVYIDTRGAIAYQHGHIENAQVFENMDVVKEQIPLQKDKKYIVYCTYGETSYEIAQELREMGYDAYNLKGGYRSWLLKHTSGYSREELLRYDRQIILPQGHHRRAADDHSAADRNGWTIEIKECESADHRCRWIRCTGSIVSCGCRSWHDRADGCGCREYVEPAETDHLQ